MGNAPFIAYPVGKKPPTWLIDAAIHFPLTSTRQYLTKNGDHSLFLLITGFIT